MKITQNYFGGWADDVIFQGPVHAAKVSGDLDTFDLVVKGPLDTFDLLGKHTNCIH